MTLRAWTAGAALAVLGGCAHIEAPPGGPEDREGPRLLVTRPDSMARLESFAGPVVLVFDEGLSEQNVEEAVEVSPRTGPVVVEKRGDELRIDLRRGWQRGRIYHVTVEPTIRDRFNNPTPEPIALVFSTGPEIPDTRLSGEVLERQSGSPARRVRVEAVHLPDSLVYATRTDSAGAFRFTRLPPGAYRVRAYNDPNASRVMEEFEARDTARVTVEAGRAAQVALSIVTPDSTAPRLTSGAAEAEVITLRFDDYLDPRQRLGTELVRVMGPDGVPLPVAEVAVGQLAARDTAAPDPARRDTTGADTAAAPRAPAASQTLVVRMARSLTPEASYRVAVVGVRNLVGLVGGGTVEFRAPRGRPAAPAAAPAGAPPPAPPPATPPRPPR